MRVWGCDGDGDEGDGGGEGGGAFAASECAVIGAGADLAAGRMPVVQCIAATNIATATSTSNTAAAASAAAAASTLAAGCGRSVVPLRFVTDAAAPSRLVACTPHPPLPSAVSNLLCARMHHATHHATHHAHAPSTRTRTRTMHQCTNAPMHQCTMHLAPCTVHRAQCTVHRAQCTVHSAPCTVRCSR